MNAGSGIADVTTFVVEKPSGTFCNCQRLFISNPALATSVTANATCATASRPEARVASREAPLRLSERNAVAKLPRLTRSTGSSPKTTDVPTASSSVIANTRPLIATSAKRGVSGGNATTKARNANQANVNPNIAPRADTIRLSTANNRTIRARPAPSAERTAISRDRIMARPIYKPATFTHATSNTNPTAPYNSTIVERVDCTTDCCSPTTSTCCAHPSGIRIGNDDRARGKTIAASARAWSVVTPGFSRPTNAKYVDHQ